MRIAPGSWMTTGTGFLLLGAAWLLFWLGPAFHLYEADPRWARTFAFALVVITLGISSLFPTVATGVISLVASFIIIPAGLAFLLGTAATIVPALLLTVSVVVTIAEHRLDRVPVSAGPRQGSWLGAHLPADHGSSTTLSHAMLPVPVLVAITGQYAVGARSARVKRAGFAWALCMLFVPLASIAVPGQ